MIPARKKPDNRGFSLVELILAIAILGIVAAPLLHSFVTAARTADKGRAAGNATAAAQNVVEVLDTVHMSALTDNLGLANAGLFGAEKTAFYTDSLADADATPAAPRGQARYFLGLRGLNKTADAHLQQFDALVTLDAAPYGRTNAAEVTQYTPMDAVFSQPEGASENPDFLAAQAFADEATALSGLTHTASSFQNKMTRVITISLQKDAAKHEITIRADYDYKYPFAYQILEPQADGSPIFVDYQKKLTETFSYEFYRGGYTDDALGLAAVYVFYYPTYLPASAGRDDTIVLQNPHDLPLPIFLIKQKTPGLGEVALSAREASYHALVELRESTRNRGGATLYSNAGRNLISGGEIGLSYQIYHGAVWYRRGTVNGDLVARKAQNRMYDVTVSLFRPGADFRLDTPILTLHAAKLD